MRIIKSHVLAFFDCVFMGFFVGVGKMKSPVFY